MKSYRFLKNEDGSILPFVALLLAFVLIGLCALVIDAGMLYAERRSLVTAADAAALGGADVFEKALSTIGGPKSVEVKAIEVAKNLGVANGVKNRDDVDVKVKWDVPYEKSTRDIIQVTVKNNTELFFARIFGYDTTDVMAKAVATWGYDKKIEGGDILPIFTTSDSYQSNTLTYLHAGKFIDPKTKEVVGGNWGLIDIYGSTNNIKLAFSGDETVLSMAVLDYVINNQTGLEAGNVVNPIEDRMQTANDLSDKEERIKFMCGLVPVINWEDVPEEQGSSLKLPIAYFAVFEIYDVITDNKGNGSLYALYDKPDYFLENDIRNAPIHYEVDSKAVEKCSIVGKFTGQQVDVRAVVEPGDQEPPEDGVLSATYSKLIE